MICVKVLDVVRRGTVEGRLNSVMESMKQLKLQIASILVCCYSCWPSLMRHCWVDLASMGRKFQHFRSELSHLSAMLVILIENERKKDLLKHLSILCWKVQDLILCQPYGAFVEDSGWMEYERGLDFCEKNSQKEITRKNDIFHQYRLVLPGPIASIGLHIIYNFHMLEEKIN